MNALREFMQEEGWQHLAAVIGCFLIAPGFHFIEKWKNRQR